MTDKVKRFRSAASEEAAPERRSHFRVLASVDMRVRMAPLAANEIPDGERDLVAAFEDLSSSAARYRKELSGTGRAFVDRLMAVLDGAVGQLAHASDAPLWASEGVIEATVSAGGMGFRTRQKLALDELVEVQFAVLSVASSIPFRARAIVRRCHKVGPEVYDVGLEYAEMAPSTRERLVRLVFDLQRIELRRRAEP
jgi:hypothetical protein